MGLIKYQGSYAIFGRAVSEAAEHNYDSSNFYSRDSSRADVEYAFEAGVDWVIEQIRKGDLVIE